MSSHPNAVAAKRRLEILSANVEMTRALGEQLGARLERGDVIALQGDLGAGKTNFTQGLAQGLAIVEDVNSPTFILANEYFSGRLPLYHIDAYRVADAAEADAFGLDDYLNSDGVTVVEWAERVRAALPSDVLWLTLDYRGENERRLEFSAYGEQSAARLDELKHAIGS
ncbi:MAG: tRNA (adenosine(37)-N6)-threonylcarbamoyltransferase complex ATPase subunit type 1 TsaE [Chloroflexi bacterium UTCFX4]|nr:MAG: tRNA (adenosine(37)-N6)-threonylcarbamoyltransferase complex ATPase subunit type 1 TsaE [Chloroflexi bacterium UTCFX4]